MFCVKTIVNEDKSLGYEVNKMISLDVHEPIKTFPTQKEAHDYVVQLIEEFKASLSSKTS